MSCSIVAHVDTPVSQNSAAPRRDPATLALGTLLALMVPMTRRLMPLIAVTLLIPLGACTSNASDSSADAGVSGDAGAQSRCPAAPPTDGERCDTIVAPSTTCLYERCGAEGIVRAACDASGGPSTWSITADACSSDGCNGTACSSGSVCAANVGGAFIVDCRPHACETGPLTCECVCGAGTQCDAGDFNGSNAEFTCYVDCGAEICAFPGFPTDQL